MFSLDVIDTDLFLDMPSSSQNLYFHLAMRARDKGLAYNAESICRSLGISISEIETLIQSGFVHRGAGCLEITHWYENNGIGETARKRNSYRYRKWREAVLSRDGNRCTVCSSPNNLQAHHIKGFSKNPALRFVLSNGKTVCGKCHSDIHRRS